MFFVPLIRWLANHDNPRVVLGVGVVLVCVGIGVARSGSICTNRPSRASVCCC
ncbi:MAG TPA: hypothetical protein VIJ96_15305 [Acidothermaceae bacterium]